MVPPTTSLPASSANAFEQRVANVKASKSDINDLILDYLTTEGYPRAAAKFSTEANLRPHQEEKSISARYEIQHRIHKGNIQGALDLINEIDSELLDREPALHSDILRLQLIELIREYNSAPGGDIMPALNFASQQLAPRASTNVSFLEDLEKTMALLVFPHDQLDPSQSALLEPSLRKLVADNVNKTILARHKQRKEASIRNLVRLRAWAEDKARNHKIDIPARLDLDIAAEQEVQDAGLDVMRGVFGLNHVR